MAHFQDLSPYIYHYSFSRPGTRNVGWLALGHTFDKMVPDEEILRLLWEHCKLSVAQMRGIHECELCPPPPPTVYAAKNGFRVLLGSSEIRVFSTNGAIYAAPNLIYHYVRTHHYRPPQEFVRALRDGPRPPDQTYFEQLQKLGFEYGQRVRESLIAKRFRFEKTGGELRRIEIENAVYLDED